MYLMQGSWTWCSFDGWRQSFSRAKPITNAAYCPADCSRHGLLSLTALCTPWSCHSELPGWRKPAGEDWRLWNVKRCVQHRLLQGKRLVSSVLVTLASQLVGAIISILAMQSCTYFWFCKPWNIKRICWVFPTCMLTKETETKEDFLLTMPPQFEGACWPPLNWWLCVQY